MPPSSTNPVTLDDWARRESIRFDAASDQSLSSAVDRMIAAMGSSVELLGLGEPMHGANDFLVLRNQIFKRLVETHGFSAIALESSFPRSRIVDDYVAGSKAAVAPSSYDDLKDTGFSHGFGSPSANRDLVEWMRAYNADPAHNVKLRFYGFDSPTEMMWSDSPRRLVEFVLDYLASHDPLENAERRRRISELLGEDAAWENQEAAYNPAKSIGLSPAANALRVEVEELASELSIRRPELTAARSEELYVEAIHYTNAARQLLTYHAGVARPAVNRIAVLLGIRDAMMADNLAYMHARERGRGRVLAFAHNSHLKRGIASWQFGPDLLEWWPAGAHVSTMLGQRYAVIGTAVGASATNGITMPEPGTLESHLTAAPGPARLIPTHGGQPFDTAALAAIPTRSGSTQNPGYFPLTAPSLTDFDWLAVFNSID